MCNYLYTPLPFCNLHGSVSTPVVSCFVSLSTVIVYMSTFIYNNTCMCAKFIAQRGQCQETNTVRYEADWCISLVHKHT